MMSNVYPEINEENITFNDLAIEICKKIREYMKRNNISQKELAQHLGCSEACISKQLSGKTNLTLKTIIRLLKAINVKMTVLLQPIEKEEK